MDAAHEATRSSSAASSRSPSSVCGSPQPQYVGTLPPILIPVVHPQIQVKLILVDLLVATVEETNK